MLEFYIEIVECLGEDVLWCDNCDVIHVDVDFAKVAKDVDGADYCFIDCPAEKEGGGWVALEYATGYKCMDCASGDCFGWYAVD